MGGVLLLALGLVAIGILAATDLLGVRNASVLAQSSLRDGIADLADGDTDTALSKLAEAQEALEDARSHTDGIGFRFARLVPVLGGDVRIVDTSVGAATELTSAIEGVVEYHVSPHEPLYDRGTFNPTTAAGYTRAWEQAADGARATVQRLEGLPEAETGLVQDATEELRLRTDQALSVTTAMRALFGRLTQASQGEDPLQIGFIFTNGAELRATTGVPVFLARLDVDARGLDLGFVNPSAGSHPDGPLPTPDDFQSLFGHFKASHLWSNLTMALDGPTVAEVGASMFERSVGTEVDLIVVADLVATGYLMDSFPDIEVDGEPFDPNSIATDFLVDSYRNYPDGGQNIYLLGMFDQVFDQLLDTDPNPRRLLSGLRRSVEEGRLLAWSPDPAIQDGMALAGADGALDYQPARVDMGVQNIGASKLDIYTTVDASLETEPVGCAVLAHLQLDIDESAPADERPLLRFDADSNRWWVNLYLPPEASLQALYSNGEATNGGQDTWGERSVASVYTEAPIGGTGSVGVEWLTPVPESGTITVSLGATVSEPARNVSFDVPPIEGCGPED